MAVRRKRKKGYEEKDFEEFEQLYYMSSGDQLERIRSRLEMPKFIEKHGKEVCDIMYERVVEEEGNE